MSKKGRATLAENRAARFHYECIEEYVAGVALSGAEVKSCKTQRPALMGAYITLDARGAWLKKCDIPPYRFAHGVAHDRLRDRQLLLHARELAALRRGVEQGGVSIVPLNMHLAGQRIKLRLALARGKKKYEKRDAIKQRDLDREARGRFRR